MPSVQDFRDGLTDDSLRFAIIAGLATVPFTIVRSWEPVADDGVVVGGSISGTAILLAGLIVGYYYSDRETETRRAGSWTGLAASIGVVPVSVANTVATVRSLSFEWTIAAIAATLIVMVAGIGFTVLFTTISALFVDWVKTKLTRDRVADPAEADDEHVAASRWWLPVGAYAVLAPIIPSYTLLVGPEEGVGVAVTILGLFVLFFLSIVALVGLFIDATAPRDAETKWIPNVWAYVGGPLGTYALAYLVAVALSLDYPPGYAIYSYFAALWIAAAVYVVFRERHVGTVSVSARL